MKIVKKKQWQEQRKNNNENNKCDSNCADVCGVCKSGFILSSFKGSFNISFLPFNLIYLFKRGTFLP